MIIIQKQESSSPHILKRLKNPCLFLSIKLSTFWPFKKQLINQKINPSISIKRCFLIAKTMILKNINRPNKTKKATIAIKIFFLLALLS
jgi:hypothetical protein